MNLLSVVDVARKAGKSNNSSLYRWLEEMDWARGAKVGTKVDLDHPGVRLWIKRAEEGKQSRLTKEEQKVYAEIDSYLALRELSGDLDDEIDPEQEISGAKELFELEVRDTLQAFAKYLDLTLREIIKKHGSDRSFKEYLAAVKSIEDINDKRLRNQQRANQVINRDFVRQHMIMLIDSTNSRILNDSPRTIVDRVRDEMEAGESAEHSEESVREILSKQLRSVKTSVVRRLKSVGSEVEDDDNNA